MQQVIHDLERVGRTSRRMLILQRGALLISGMLAALLIAIGIDFLLRFPSPVRLVILLGGIVALAYAFIRHVRPALGFYPSLTQLALRVERMLPAVGGRLASSVEFATAGLDQNNPLAARSLRDTQSRLAGETVRGVISASRTWRSVGLMLAGIAMFIALAAWSPQAAATGLARLFMPYSAAKWPARTGVESLMLQVMGERTVFPRGQALPLRAGVTRGAKDQTVDAWYRLRTEEGLEDWQHIVLTHQGKDVQSGGVHERLVDTNARAIEFYFATDDDETARQTVELVPPPAVVRATLHVTPPEYATGKAPALKAELGPGVDERAVTDTASLAGSSVHLRLELNKSITPPEPDDGTARAEWLRKTLGWVGEDLPLFAVDPTNADVWNLRWTLNETRALHLDLEDQYGLGNTEPISYRITAVEDRPPSVTIIQPPSDEAVLPTAVISVLAEARDDVALTNVGVEARVQNVGRSAEDVLKSAADWSEFEPIIDATGQTSANLDLSTMTLSTGDIVLVNATAEDGYIDAAASGGGESPEGTPAAASPHRARSAVRRLRITSEVELATQLRRQLAAVRQNAIRIEALQGELQDDVGEHGVPANSGLDRAQAQLGERIASQRQSVEDVQRLLQQNKLNDQPLASILQQTQDLLDHAGRASTKATEAIQSAQSSGAKPSTENPSANQAQQSPDQKSKPSEKDADADANDPAKIQPITEAQQEVRDELSDLIKLLDRDEDTWVARRQLENLLDEQTKLEQATGQLGQQTVGQTPEQLSEEHKTALDRITQKQEDLADRTRQAVDDFRKKAQSMAQVDPQAAQGMKDAANTAERQQLDRDQQEASKKIQQNQMRSAQASQQSAGATMQKMLQDIAETRRAQTQELVRRLASLIESITRLITVQENELAALGKARPLQDFTNLDRGMIRLSQNTQAVETEARTAGQETRRVARSLDRAADAQGAAIKNLRAQPVLADDAEGAETRSLELLREAKKDAEELQKKTQEEEVRQRREELIAKYRAFAEQQVAVREETLELTKVAQLDRRQLVASRRLGSTQDDIRRGLGDLRDVTSEILESPIFAHTHRLMQDWSIAASEALQAGTVTVDVTDRQQLVADSIGRIISALEEAMSPPDEFAQDGQNDAGQQGGEAGQKPPLIPPVAQLKLLRGLQEQVYDQTRTIDSRTDMDEAQRRLRLRDIGQQQRDLMVLGQQMLESLRNEGGEPAVPMPEIKPGDAGEPTPEPMPEPEPAAPDSMPEPEQMPHEQEQPS